MSNITNNYLKVLEVINSLNIDSGSLGRIGRKPKMADIEVVALSLTAEFMSIDSENDLFRQVSSLQIPNLIERSQFNKRRRKLFGFSETIRLAMASRFTELEDYFIVDSMPLEICKTARQNRIRVCKENYETAPEKGFRASKNTWFYGYKLHGVCTLSGVFHSVLRKQTCMMCTICRMLNINSLNVCFLETRGICLLNSNWTFLNLQRLFWKLP